MTDFIQQSQSFKLVFLFVILRVNEKTLGLSHQKDLLDLLDLRNQTRVLRDGKGVVEQRLEGKVVRDGHVKQNIAGEGVSKSQEAFVVLLSSVNLLGDIK